MDGDGKADFAIAATGNGDGGPNGGKLYVFFGASIAASAGGSIALTTADVIAIGLAPDDRLGTSIAALGDVDGDGRDDFAVGAPRHDQPGVDAGAAWIVSGAGLSSGLTLDLSAPDFAVFGLPGDGVGAAVVSAGDADGDGRRDLLLGNGARDAAIWMPGAGLGPAGTVSDGHAFAPVVAGDRLGSAAVCPGDVDGDGRDDLLLGASGAGAVYVLRSPFGP